MYLQEMNILESPRPFGVPPPPLTYIFHPMYRLFRGVSITLEDN